MKSFQFLTAVLTIALFAVVSFNISSSLTFTSALADSLSLFVFIVFFLGLIFIIQKNYHSKKALDLQNSSTILLFSFLIIFFNYFIVKSYETEELFFQFITEIIILKSILVLLLLTVFFFLFWIEEHRKQELHFQNFVIEKEKENNRIQLNSLQQQFKPHFLFNSLNSINALTISNPKEAQKMVHLLSEFMRGAVKVDQSEKVELKEEIHHIDLYANIEKIRFGDRLKVDFKIPKECLTMKIPTLILQPIIENAIKYGLSGGGDEVSIEISAKKEQNRLIVSISNPFDEDIIGITSGTGYGLSSIRKKMLILYNQSNLLETKKENATFTTILQIPQL